MFQKRGKREERSTRGDQRRGDTIINARRMDSAFHPLEGLRDVREVKRGQIKSSG